VRSSGPRIKDRQGDAITQAERVEWAIVAVLEAARRQAARPDDHVLVSATNARVKELDDLVQLYRRVTVVAVSVREAP
jgi:hypothetical protein